MPAFLTSLLTAASAVMLGPNGTWDLRAGDQTLFRIEIKEEPGGPVATWDRPERFQTNGEIFSHIEGPTVRRQTRNIRVVNSDLEISFDDPGSDPTVLRLHPVDAGHAELSFQGAPFEPLPLVKAQAGGPPIGPWDSGRSYVPTVTRPTNAEMTAIFDADQADRQSPDIDCPRLARSTTSVETAGSSCSTPAPCKAETIIITPLSFSSTATRLTIIFSRMCSR